MSGQSAGKNRMQDTDLAWLAGIWDGEGSIAFFSHKEKTGNTKLKPMVNVINTDFTIINKVRKLLEELGCNFSFQERHPNNVKHNIAWVLLSSNQKYIIIFLTAIYPYLVSIKKQKAEVLIDYCSRRAAKTERFPSKGSTPYDTEDRELYDKFQNIRSSQTTRENLVTLEI